jgi:hypothetical protein
MEEEEDNFKKDKRTGIYLQTKRKKGGMIKNEGKQEAKRRRNSRNWQQKNIG